MPGDDVVAKDSLTVQEVFDLLHVAGAFRLRFQDRRQRARGMFVHVRITRGDDTGHIPVIIRERINSPLFGISLWHAISIEQITHTHDVLVAVMGFVDHLLLLQDLAGGCHCPLQQTPGCRTAGWLQGLLLGLGERLQTEGLSRRVEEDRRVMGKPAEAGSILTLQVTRTAQQVGIITVGLFKDAFVQGQTLPVDTLEFVDEEKDAQAISANGDIGQQGVRVGTRLAAKLFQPVRIDVVDVCQAQAGPTVDVLLLLAAVKPHSHSETRTRGFLAAGSDGIALRQEVAMFFGMVPHCR